MKTVWLFSRIARRSRNGDYTKLSYMEQQDVAEAANAALTQIYNALPTYFKEMTEGFVLPAPLTLTNITVVNGSADLSADVFLEEQIGRSVTLGDDPNWNQVVSTNRLLNPYVGSSGVVGGTVYGDAVWSERYPFERIIGNPVFANPSLGFFAGREMSRVNSQGVWPWQQQIGLPQAWWTQPLGNSQGNEPLLVLRVSPAPDQDYVIDVRMSYWSKRLVPQDYTDNTTIPVPDQFLESILIPLALQAFMSSPAWQAGPDDARVMQRAEAALLMARNQYGQPGAPSNRVFTPIGF